MTFESIALFAIFEEPAEIPRTVFKYVLMSVTDNTGQLKHIIRAGDNAKGFSHLRILGRTRTDLGPDFTVNHYGGGFIKIAPKIKTIILSGESDHLKAVDKELVAKILADLPAFAGFEFVLS